MEDIAVKFQARNSVSYKAPITLGIDFSTLANNDEDDEESRNFPYRELIGSLMYAATVSHPDIAVNKLILQIPAELIGLYPNESFNSFTILEINHSLLVETN
jgi:hypothetical protein